MPVDPTGGIASAVVGAVGFVFSLPKEFLYLIFLGFLVLETGIIAFVGFEHGALATVLNFLTTNIFQTESLFFTTIQATSFIWFIFFLIVPFAILSYKH